ncbi:MAG: PAS domain S-box protein [Desulfobacterales bacterium]|nr:PAS domain S-box protein [Desulfobacterales bacterium]
MIPKPTRRDLEAKLRELETKLHFYDDLQKSKGDSPALQMGTNERRFRNLIEGSIQGVLIHRDHKPLFVNKQWASIHGYLPEEILKMDSIIPLISPRDQRRMIAYKDARLKGRNAPIHYEYEGVRKDGSLVWLENRVMIVQWEGQPAIQTTIFDITDRKLAENALQESENRYRAVIEDLPALICSFLPGGEITFVNKAYCDFFDKRCEELVGSNFLSLIPESDHQTVMENIAALTIASPTQSHEHPVLAENGKICWQRWTNRAIFDDRKKIISYQSFGVDITARKKADEALRESEELHRIILSNISDAVFITDDKGDFTYICPNVSVIFGRSYEEVSALSNINNLLDMHDLNRSELIASGEIRNIEREIQDKSGATHIVLVNVKLVSIKGGTMLISCRDITERKRAYVELQESEARYRQLFDNASDAVMIFDAHSKHFEDANSAATDLFGYTKDEFAKLTVEDISVEKDNAMTAAGKIGMHISGYKYAHLHYFKKKNGTIFPGEIYVGTFISNVRKKIIGAVRDVTNRIKAEETIRDLSFSLLTAQEMERKRIASDLHDDLGQTLAYLKIRIQNLQKSLPQHRVNLHRECENTLEYTNQLIEKVRQISHGLTPIFLDDLGLTASLHSLVDEFSGYASIKIEKQIANIDRLFSPEVEITIYRIIQEIMNNIWKHAETNFVKVEITKVTDKVSFKIEDCGRGFDFEKIELFTSDKKGLGLASVNERVRMLGGCFDIQSRLHKGTNVAFWIPFESKTDASGP